MKWKAYFHSGFIQDGGLKNVYRYCRIKEVTVSVFNCTGLQGENTIFTM